MLDFEGNIFIPIFVFIGIVLGILFFVVSRKTLFAKLIKISLGIACIVFLGLAFWTNISDNKRLKELRKEYEKQVVGIYFLDKVDSDFDESLILPDTLVLELVFSHMYLLNSDKLTQLPHVGMWSSRVSRMNHEIRFDATENFEVEYGSNTIFIRNTQPYGTPNFKRLVFRK